MGLDEGRGNKHIEDGVGKSVLRNTEGEAMKRESGNRACKRNKRIESKLIGTAKKYEKWTMEKRQNEKDAKKRRQGEKQTTRRTGAKTIERGKQTTEKAP